MARLPASFFDRQQRHGSRLPRYIYSSQGAAAPALICFLSCIASLVRASKAACVSLDANYSAVKSPIGSSEDVCQYMYKS